jgi:hypothetical protein
VEWPSLGQEIRLNAARKLIEESDELSPDEKQQLNESVPELMHDGPRTAVAVVSAYFFFVGSAAFFADAVFGDFSSSSATAPAS